MTKKYKNNVGVEAKLMDAHLYKDTVELCCRFVGNRVHLSCEKSYNYEHNSCKLFIYVLDIRINFVALIVILIIACLIVKCQCGAIAMVNIILTRQAALTAIIVTPFRILVGIVLTSWCIQPRINKGL